MDLRDERETRKQRLTTGSELFNAKPSECIGGAPVL
jgi:hypothetical protein